MVPISLLYTHLLFPYYFDLWEPVKDNLVGLYEEFYAIPYITLPKITDSPDCILFNFKLYSYLVSPVVQEKA